MQQKVGITDDQMEKLLSGNSTLGSIIGTVERRISKECKCKSPSKCELKELILSQWAYGNITSQMPKEYEKSKYAWNKTTCVSLAYGGSSNAARCPEIVHYLIDDHFNISIDQAMKIFDHPAGTSLTTDYIAS